MCLICTDLLKQKMDIQDAIRNCRELYSTDEHYRRLLEALEEMDLDKLQKELVRE